MYSATDFAEEAARYSRWPAAWDGLHDVNLTEAFTFSPERGETATLRYRLTEPARVQIRVKDAFTRELYLATILNWDLREAGERREVWDGRDYSGNPVDWGVVSVTSNQPDDTEGVGDGETTNDCYVQTSYAVDPGTGEGYGMVRARAERCGVTAAQFGMGRTYTIVVRAFARGRCAWPDLAHSRRFRCETL